jgi:hypothetical protein
MKGKKVSKKYKKVNTPPKVLNKTITIKSKLPATYHNNVELNLIQNQTNSVPIFLKIHFNITLPPITWYSKFFFSPLEIF